MYPLNEIPYVEIELHWDKTLKGPPEQRARQLRGALARIFCDDDLFHQHGADGKPLYRYPRIQYRWHDDRAIIVGWWDAAGRLLQLPWLDLNVVLGEDEVSISDAVLTMQTGMFAVSPQLLRYRLCSPALLFNQNNYRRYRGLDASAQRQEQDRLLVAQLLAAMQGLGVFFDAQLYAGFGQISTQPCRYKQDMLGISGEFLSNALLPDGFAFGHGVSHGFGWIVSY